MNSVEKAYCLWFVATIAGLFASIAVVATTKGELGPGPAHFFIAMLFGLFPTGIMMEIALRRTRLLLPFRLPAAVTRCLLFTGGLWLLMALSLYIHRH